MFGESPDAVELQAEVVVHHCDDCDLQFTDATAEVARHEAVCNHLGMLTPREITAIREHYGLGRAEFSRVTRIGEATLARWERGALIQNPAYDQYLRLIADPRVFDLLRGRSPVAPIRPAGAIGMVPRFRALPDIAHSRADASVFSLRRKTG